ncbi:hypothetical protein LCGC14_2697900, partial [marine sediment metagenome]
EELSGAFGAFRIGFIGHSPGTIRMDGRTGSLSVEELAREQIVFEKSGLHAGVKEVGQPFSLLKGVKASFKCFCPDDMNEKMIKRLEKLLLIPLALMLTGCPEEFELKKMEIDRVTRIQCKITGYIFPDEGKKWDTIFQAWYGSQEEPDWEHWYSRRKSLPRASEDCDKFFRYMRFPK